MMLVLKNAVLEHNSLLCPQIKDNYVTQQSFLTQTSITSLTNLSIYREVSSYGTIVNDDGITSCLKKEHKDH